MHQLPLSGVRVIELSQGIAGPYCGKLLADYGAEVIKVEPPGKGDVARSWGPFPEDIPHPERSGTFLFYNTNKLGVTLNFTPATGRRILRELLSSADILIEDFRPGLLDSLGLDWPSLRGLNSGLIQVSITPFGREGPYSQFKGGELVGAAMGGIMSISGDRDREPIAHGVPFVQHIAGQNAFLATLLALVHKRRTGEGQHIDLSMMECAAWSIPFAINYYTYMGAVWGRPSPRKPVFGLELHPCRDGYVGMSIIRTTNLSELAEFFGTPELNQPRWLSEEERYRHQEELENLVLPRLRERGKMEFFLEAHRRHLMASVALTPRENLENEQLKARGYYQRVEHPYTGGLMYPGDAMGLPECPRRNGRAPLLGEHNQEVFSGRLGYSRDDLVRLKAHGII